MKNVMKSSRMTNIVSIKPTCATPLQRKMPFIVVFRRNCTRSKTKSDKIQGHTDMKKLVDAVKDVCSPKPSMSSLLFGADGNSDD